MELSTFLYKLKTNPYNLCKMFAFQRPTLLLIYQYPTHFPLANKIGKFYNNTTIITLQYNGWVRYLLGG